MPTGVKRHLLLRHPPPFLKALMPSLPIPSHRTSSTKDGAVFARSVAGEEDPGASLDCSNVQPEKTFNTSDQPVNVTTPPLAPGDEAAPGTPGTGENVCRVCGGTGQCGNTGPCPECAGTGRVTVGIGGA